MQEENSLSVSDNSIDSKPQGKVAKKNGQRVGYYYIITKSLKESRKNDVMKCFYIKGLFNFGACVIKEGCHGDSKDSHGRDIKDRLLWQKEMHQLLQDKVRIPRYIDCFEENGNYYLVIERIKGRTLSQTLKKKSDKIREGLLNRDSEGKRFLSYLLDIIDLLEKLHNEQVVHRDATSNNFMITPGGKIALIDMELSYSIQQQQPEFPYQLGTHGYMSPQQLKTLTPTTQEDIFALGAIIAQLWTNISPSKMNDASYEDLKKRIYFFIPDQQVADVVIQCMHPEPTERPNLQAIRKTIFQYRSASLMINRSSSPSYSYNKEQICATIQEVINTLSTPLLADPEKGWFTESNKGPDIADKKQINKAWYASFTRGAAGVIYVLNRAQRMGFDISATMPFIEKGIELISLKYVDLNGDTSPSLNTGSSGIAVVLSEAINAEVIDKDLGSKIPSLLHLNTQSLDISNGIAGQGLAAIISSSVVGKQETEGLLNDCFKIILSEQQKDGCWLFKGEKDKKKIIPGFSKGTAGIIYYLLCYSEHSGNKEALKSAERGLQWLIKKAVKRNNTFSWRSSTGKKLSQFIDQGEAGIAMAFIKGFALTGNSQYKKYATGALLNIPEKIVSGNLSHSNGLCGLGEIYLDAYHTLRDNIWQDRANWIAQHILHLKNTHPVHGKYWIVQHERQPIPTFAAGVSGVLHFLLRYCYPERISFPMLPSKETSSIPVTKASLHIYSK